MGKWLAAAIAIVLSHSAMAREPAPMVSAKDPASLVNALKNAGYGAELGKDKGGDPLIKTELEGFDVRLVFYGCKKESNDDCGSILLSTGFDRKKPWSAEAAIDISKRFRFASVRLDDEGDPYIEWDIVTGEGIPTGVFLRSVRNYASTIDDASKIIFAED